MAKELYEFPGFLLRRVHQISVGIFERHCRSLNLTPSQYGVLYILSTHQAVNQSALARALGHDKVTTLHIVRGLEARGLLSKRNSPTDKRRMELSLTPEGEAVFNEVIPLAAQAHKQMLDPLSPNERTAFMAMLEKLCVELEEDARAPMVKLKTNGK